VPLLVALAVAGVGARSPLAVRWLPWRERFYGNCISCTSSRRTVNALERRHASLKIESQLSIDEELASIERMEYSGRRLMAARARAPAAHLHTIESAEESVRMMRACQSARPMLLLLRDSQGGTGEPSPASASSPSLFAACAWYQPSVLPCNAWTLLPGMRHLTRLLHHPVSRPSSTREPPSRPN